jgi:hypothetical protein
MAVGQREAVIVLALSLLSTVSSEVAAVTPFPAGALVLHKANYFDLQHRRIRFVPASGSRYMLSVGAWSVRPQRGSVVAKPFSKVSLAFPFPFGGRTWNAVYVNLNGNLTFDAPDVNDFPERDTWPDGTMRSLSGYPMARCRGRLRLGGRRQVCPHWICT